MVVQAMTEQAGLTRAGLTSPVHSAPERLFTRTRTAAKAAVKRYFFIRSMR